MKKILCVCRGNISRSPMMQAILTQVVEKEYVVESAGVNSAFAGKRATKSAVACMKERGLDISGHVSRYVGELALPEYFLIVCVGQEEYLEIKTMLDGAPTEVVVANKGDGIPDPFMRGMEEHRRCAGLIERSMYEIVEKFL